MKSLLTGSRSPSRALPSCALVLATSALLWSACNVNTVELVTQPSTFSGFDTVPIGGQVAMDILWVVDNSFSMCEEQKVLRDNFKDFVSELGRTNLDFHIALTTTHAPESSVTIEPVARESVIQSTPQPIPGNNASCLRGAGAVSGVSTEFAPLREALAIATECLADPSRVREFVWSDAQLGCALRSPAQQAQTGCVAESGLSDRNRDGGVDIFDLFPNSSDYRIIPRVLRASEYRDASGNLDQARLAADFACMSTVGTRGDGYEKGLRAAVNAVSPALTGGAVELATADLTRPNHGFIRQGAKFALIFVTDENDCSHDGTLQEAGNPCGADACEYEASLHPSVVSQSRLVAVEDLATQLRQNLAATKGFSSAAELPEDALLISSIQGTSRPLMLERIDRCDATNTPAISPVCSSPLGSAQSGDRYERFIRQFSQHYPNSVVQRFGPEARLDFTRYEPLGWMCEETFAPALGAIGQFIASSSPVCITSRLLSCQTSAECPDLLYTGVRGECVAANVAPDEEPYDYCTSAVALIVERDPAVEALSPEINQLEYCIPESINRLDTKHPACVINPRFYTLSPCASGAGIAYQWVEPPHVVASKLSGYNLLRTFVAEPK